MKCLKYALLILFLSALTKPAYADFIMPVEISNIDRLSSAAFSRSKSFKRLETVCLNNDCGTTYYEFNRPETRVHFKITQGGKAIEGYVVDGITYERGSGGNAWVKTKTLPRAIVSILSLEGQSSLENCLRSCPTYKPEKILLEEGIIDGKDVYIVKIVYPKETEELPFKTASRVFYEKNTYLPHGQSVITEGAKSKISFDVKNYDYDVPLEINLPAEAINAREVSLEEIESLR